MLKNCQIQKNVSKKASSTSSFNSKVLQAFLRVYVHTHTLATKGDLVKS